MNKAVERKINEIYKAVWKKIVDKKTLDLLLKGDISAISKKSVILERSDIYDKFADKFAKELAKQGLSKEKGVWRKYFEAAKTLHYVGLPKTFKEYEEQQMIKAIEHNKKMIKTIPSEVLKVFKHKYTETLINQVAKGTLPRGSFQRELEKHGSTNAKVIARTETAKLQTEITENRAKELGSVAYIWLSSNDKRTRPSHKEMNGVIVFWRPDSQKPLLDKMRGNAGEFPNCRCDTEPILDLDDLNKAQYKVYDYRVDKIITISKQELIKTLKKGEL